MVSRRSLLLRFKWLRPTIAATLAFCLACLLSLAVTVHALDPNKHVTQYMHTSWRVQDGSLPAGMYHITQTSDGFIWLLSLPGDIYRFDGVRFLPWHFPAGAPMDRALNILADHSGGLWALGHNDIVRLTAGAVTSHFQLQGNMFQSISEDLDGSLWVAQRSSDAPLCHVTRALKCFGKPDRIPISDVETLLADGKGGFWLGGQTALVHWHDGVSQTYQLEGVKDIGNGIQSLARGSDGSLWVGILGEGAGGLRQLKDGVITPFLAGTFDGRKIAVTAMIFDRHGNLWVGTDAKGLFRINGDAVEHYDHTDGLSSDSVWALFEDREGIVWAGTASGIDVFRDPAVATFSLVEGVGTLPAGILASRYGSIWVGTAGSLDHIVNGTVSSIRSGKGLPGTQVTRMLEDRAGNLWVGVDD